MRQEVLMKRNILILLSLAGVLLTAMPLVAHHAISAEFDSAKPIKFTGTVKSVDWMNPHIYVNIEPKTKAERLSSIPSKAARRIRFIARVGEKTP